MSDKPSVFTTLKQGRGDAPAAHDAEVITLPLADYEPFASHPPRGAMSWVRVYFSDGTTSSFPCFSIKEILSTSPNFLSLILDTGTVITLQGRNLTALHEAIEDDRVRTLKPFDERRHAPPASADDAPFIASIVRETGDEDE